MCPTRVVPREAKAFVPMDESFFLYRRIVLKGRKMLITALPEVIEQKIEKLVSRLG